MKTDHTRSDDFILVVPLVAVTIAVDVVTVAGTVVNLVFHCHQQQQQKPATVAATKPIAAPTTT